MSPHTLQEVLPVHLSKSNIKEYVNQKMEICNLVKISISGQNIKSIDIDLNLSKLREIDISYNQLSEFPNRSLMENVRVLPSLEELDISWNLLSNCLQTINSFATFIPNMYKLKIFNNPFADIVDPDVIDYLIQTYIPKLQFINNCKCENLCLSQNYFPCAFNMCKLNSKRRNKLIYLKHNTCENVEQMKLLEKKNIEHAKYIHISQDFIVASNASKRAKNVQEFCATCCLLSTFPFTKPLNHLIKLNLGNNYISLLDDFTQENLPSLRYLDLTNNLITSLESMGSFYTLQEFYCGNNEIEKIAQIDNVKTWQALRIIDLSENPLTMDTFYKKFLIFHLSSIEVDLSAEYLPQLESLDLSKNQITYLWGLHSFKHLRTLCLSYNCLEIFSGDEYEKTKCIYPKLYTLFLDHNYIKSVTNITKQKLPVIKHVFLNNNHLQNINEIIYCSTLESLILDYNEIEALNVEDFVENDNLKLLSLENNKIKSLEFTKALKKLKKLYVAHNCVENEIEMQYLLLLKNLEEITFEGNPLYNESNGNKIIVTDFGVRDAEIEKI
ncbi:uncharacterized protein LOC108629085 [Ceratina calcarata]|uniref:Uncharacterized protein LOC108629085 n=1 Tax=Ceratina calcarata TaxID=156304 RepID=A0AAJ7NBG0_9HYME|nr:uncharacterized protein LOC108629085 [Ceratina calcarata]